MDLRVLDGEGNLQTIVVLGPATVVNHDGALPNDEGFQVIDENDDRQGWLFYNAGEDDMWVSDTGTASDTGDSFKVSPGEYWPPAGYPSGTGPLNVKGTNGAKYLAREW